jgi:hypothetical protein
MAGGSIGGLRQNPPNSPMRPYLASCSEPMPRDSALAALCGANRSRACRFRLTPAATPPVARLLVPCKAAAVPVRDTARAAGRSVSARVTPDPSGIDRAPLAPVRYLALRVSALHACPLPTCRVAYLVASPTALTALTALTARLKSRRRITYRHPAASHRSPAAGSAPKTPPATPHYTTSRHRRPTMPPSFLDPSTSSSDPSPTPEPLPFPSTTHSLPVWAPTPLTNPHGEGAGSGTKQANNLSVDRTTAPLTPGFPIRGPVRG